MKLLLLLFYTMTIIGTAGPTHGIPSDETGILIKSLGLSFEPEFIDPLTNKDGERINEARGAACSKISVTGETNVATASGLLLATFVGAIASGLSNTMGMAGATANGLLENAGGLYMNSAKIDQSATGYKTFSAEYQQYAGIA
jgi:hypothetical protein